MELLRSPMELAAIIAGTAHVATTNTLADYTRSARLEPIAMVDRSLLSSISEEQMIALEQTMVSVFSGYYLVAIGMTLKIGDVVPIQLLDQFSTNRSILQAAGNSVYWGFENLRDDLYSIPSSKQISELYLNKNALGFGNEASGDDGNHGVNGGEVKQSVDLDKTIHNITDESNLVVGKILNIPISYGDKSTTIQTTVTLRPKAMDPGDISTILRHNSRDISFMARWHQMRSGEIKFFKDWLLNQDLMDEYRRSLHGDKSNALLDLRSSRTKNIWAAIV